MSWSTTFPSTSSEADAIVIFGGDGTVHRYLPQLVALQLPVLVVPCGSGNDFARALGLGRQRDALRAWMAFTTGANNARAFDLGVITPAPVEAENTPSLSLRCAGEAPAPGEYSPHLHYFCCVGGVGLDAEVAKRASQFPRWLRGNGGYVLGLLAALAKFVPPSIKIAASDIPESLRHHGSLPVTLAAFANTPTYGGGMKIAPQALLDDGKLDVCVVGAVRKLKLLSLFPTVYFGRHLRIAVVQYFQTEGLRLDSEQPLDVYADGEFVCQTPVQVSVTRRALRVIVGHSQTAP